MPDNKQNRIKTLLPFIAVLVFMLLMAISFWNHSLQSELPLKAWPLVFFALSIGALFYVYTQVLKITDPKLIDDRIAEEVENERTRLLASFETNDKEENDDQRDIEKLVSDILPKGSFKKVDSFLEKLFTNLSKNLQISMGLAYTLSEKDSTYYFSTGYALTRETPPESFKLGDTLNGEVARSQETLVLEDIPEDYFEVESGLGKTKPKTLLIAPVLHEQKCIAILEIATFSTADTEFRQIIDAVCKLVANKLIQIQKS